MLEVPDRHDPPVAASPDHRAARWRPSPNFGTRYDGKTINSIVLHYTGMSDGAAAEDWLCAAESGVSSHYLVHEDGAVVQMVREVDRAWHAGIGCWHGESDMNSVSVGIEIVNRGHLEWGEGEPNGPLPPFPAAQIDAVIALCLDVMARRGIPAGRVLGHSDLAPHRKRDPGEAFPWARLCEQGIGLCVEAERIVPGRSLRSGDAGADVTAFQVMLAKVGFAVEPSGDYCRHTEMTARAFQRHWRPERVDGVADMSTLETLRRLAEVVDSEKSVAAPPRR